MLIALGVCGGVGAYKAVEVARGLQKNGHDVVAVMTASATQFVGPLTFEAITRRRVITGQFESGANADIEHIALASTIDLMIVAPATANVIGKLAHGLADDFLTTLYTATRAPLLIAPAMNSQMFSHEAVQANLQTLVRRGVQIVEPGEGYLACGWIGKGRLAEPEAIVTAAEALLRPNQALKGKRLVVTAGPTYEDLDPVRYIGNRSSGRMGFAIAEEAVSRGGRVVLISGPTSVAPPAGCEVVQVRSAIQMHKQVMDHSSDADAVVMAAAVADYMPVSRSAQKVTKSDDDLHLQLTRTPDILADLGRRRAAAGHGPVLVGFAAETEQVVERARRKLERKQVDVIVANDVSRTDAGFDVETNAVTIVAADDVTEVPLQSKRRVAAAILDRVEALLRAHPVRA
jgi:phosphopantothenoylcysteine decarboxylase/phosphopantothenate--cysteine ligase